MSWRDELIERIAERPCSGYGPSDSAATEPSALAGLALAGEGRAQESAAVARWIAGVQQPDGSVGMRAGESAPTWPTSLAVLVWYAAEHVSSDPRLFAAQRQRAVHSILHQRSVTFAREEELGHDPGLLAWPWVEGTHAWVEPTALHMMALKSAGHGDHARTREAHRVLLDRQLPHGGWNYGNTLVLGRELRFHVQPTSLALLALATGGNVVERVAPSLELLQRHISPQTTTASLGWACIALAAYGRVVPNAAQFLESAYRRAVKRPLSIQRLALIAMALQHDECLLVRLPRAAQIQVGSVG